MAPWGRRPKEMLSGGTCYNMFRTSLINFLFFDSRWQILPVVTLMWRNGYSTILKFNNFVEMFVSENGLDVREIPTQKEMLSSRKDCLFGVVFGLYPCIL